MKKLPKWPKGLKTKVKKVEKAATREKEIVDRKKAIADARAFIAAAGKSKRKPNLEK